MANQIPRALYTLFVLFFFVVSGVRGAEDQLPGEISGEIGLENRFFPYKGLYGNTEKSETVLILRLEYAYSWDDDRKVVTFIPYAVVADPDSKKTHLDIREASYVAAYEKIELRVGVSKVFWGVTESQHLVDVLNQTDAILNTDGEDKFGQPMLNLTYISDYGNINFFLLPYFRERTFPGKNGRYRGPLVVNTDNAIYEDPDEEKHLDIATRYSHSFGDLDIGVSIFKGTDRRPLLVANVAETELQPFYIQTTQYGLDMQYIFDAWLFKFEGIHKNFDLSRDYNASTIGFEYTISNIRNSGLEFGIIAEHLYDDRPKTESLFYNHTFLGARLAFNDENSTELLTGIIVDNDQGDLSSLRIEGNRRINENWKWEVEANVVIDPQSKDQLNTFRRDDYIQFLINYYF